MEYKNPKFIKKVPHHFELPVPELKIVCKDGETMVLKEVLYRHSPHLKSLVDLSTGVNYVPTLIVNYRLEHLRPLLCYFYNGHFKISHEDAKDVYQIAKELQIVEIVNFMEGEEGMRVTVSTPLNELNTGPSTSTDAANSMVEISDQHSRHDSVSSDSGLSVSEGTSNERRPVRIKTPSLRLLGGPKVRFNPKTSVAQKVVKMKGDANSVEDEVIILDESPERKPSGVVIEKVPLKPATQKMSFPKKPATKHEKKKAESESVAGTKQPSSSSLPSSTAQNQEGAKGENKDESRQFRPVRRLSQESVKSLYEDTFQQETINFEDGQQKRKVKKIKINVL